MKGFTVQQHDEAGQALWTINNDLGHIRNIFWAYLPHSRHQRLLKTIYGANDDLFAFRSALDNIVARETCQATNYYFRGREGAPRLEDSHPSGCTERKGRELAAKLKSLWINNCHHRKPGRLEKSERDIVAATLHYDCVELVDLGQKIYRAGYQVEQALQTLRAFIILRGEFDGK
jgi:hypothetical protein